jgi:hypothetical protein
LLPDLDRLRGVVVRAALSRHVARPDDHPQRLPLPRQRLVQRVAHGELGVVPQHGAGADEDRVALPPQPVDVASGVLVRDPLAGAVGRGAAPVEARGELPGDEGPAVLQREGPRAVELSGLSLEEPHLDGDPGGAERLCSPGRHRVGIRLGEHDAHDARLDERVGARTRAAGVVARLERHHGRRALGGVPGLGEGRGLGVRRTGAAVEPLGDLSAVGPEEHATHARVRAAGYAGRGGQLEGAPHRTLDRCVRDHAPSSSPARGLGEAQGSRAPS